MKLRFLILPLLALALCGCYAQDTIVRVNKDGTGTIEVHAGINKAYDASVRDPDDDPQESPNVESIITTVELTAESFPTEWKATTTQWDDGTYQGAQLVLQFTNTAMLQEQLDKLLEEAKANGYSDTIVSLKSTQDQQRMDVRASLIGVTIDDGGDPLPSGAEGAGRVLWSVALPQVDQCQPNRFATCAANQASWTIPFNSLQVDETIDLATGGLLSGVQAATPTATSTTVPSTATPTIAPPTAVPATAIPSTATKPPATSAATTTPSTQQATAAGASATSVAQNATAATVASRTPTVPPSDSNLPTAIGVFPEAVAPTAQRPTGNALPIVQPSAAAQTSGATSVAHVTPTVGVVSTGTPTSGPAAEATVPTDQAFVPIVADASQADTAVQPVEAVPLAQPRSRRPTLPGRNAAIVVCLVGAGLCLGYVGVQRLRQRRAAPTPSTPEDEGL